MNKIKTYSEFLNESKTDSQFFTTYEETKEWLENMRVKNYTINDDLTVDVFGYLDLNDKGISYIPVQFRKVTDGAYVYDNYITFLKGAPISVGKYFDCSHNKLTSLEHVPQYVGEDFDCDYNQLTSLVFSPKKPNNHFGNPCSDIYYKLGFTPEAHRQCLLELDPNPLETLKRLKKVLPYRYKKIVEDKTFRVEIGLEGKELKSVYNKVKDIEKGYF